MAENSNTVVWHDRKRILGLPISFTEYYMDSERIYVKKGLFTTEINEILLYRILDVKSSRTLGQKLFGVGTVTLYSADQSNRTLELKNIKNSTTVHKFLSDTIEYERVEHGVAGREMFGTAAVDMDSADDGPSMPPPPPPDFNNY